MTGPTITCKVAFRTCRRRERQPEATVAPSGPTRLARRLALAHYIEGLIEEGALESYAAAARVLGVSRARMSQLMDLLLLAPDVQERILLGEERKSERAVRGEPAREARAAPPWARR